MSDQVAAQKAVTITDAAKLPGAFLLFRFTTAAEGTFAGIAYDATITEKTTLKQLQDKYIINGGGAGFPYIEKFSKLSGEGTNIWKAANQISYAGVFGGPDPDHKSTPSQSGPSQSTPPQNKPALYRSQLGPAWPWADMPGHPIRHGVYVSFWFLGEGGVSGKGMHTSSTGKHLDNTSQVPYMWLKPGQPEFNLIPKNASLIKNVIPGVYLDWYATSMGNGDLNWNVEKGLTP